MLPSNSTEGVLHFVDLGNGKPELLASVGLRVERASNKLSSCHIIVDRNTEDVIGTALDTGRHRNVWASRE